MKQQPKQNQTFELIKINVFFQLNYITIQKQNIETLNLTYFTKKKF